jgi:hypothetical protein
VVVVRPSSSKIEEEVTSAQATAHCISGTASVIFRPTCFRAKNRDSSTTLSEQQQHIHRHPSSSRSK